MTPQYCFPCNAKKEPRVKEWQRKLFQWQPWKFAPLVGVQTGFTNGFDVLDVDTYKPSGAAWWDANASILPTTYTHHTRRGGKHLFFRNTPGLRGSIDKIAEGVDIRAERNFIVWWPREGFTVDDYPIADIPEWLLKEAMGKGSRRITRDLSTSKGEESEGASERRLLIAESVTAALRQLNVLKFADHDAWFALMLGAKAVGIDCQDFVDWSIGDPTYSGDGEIIEKRWHSVPGVHGGAFYSALKAAGIKLTLPRKPNQSHTHTHIHSLLTSAEVSRTSHQTSQADFQGQPTFQGQGSNIPGSAWDFFQRSYKPGDRFHGMIAKLKADGREDLLFWTACEAFAMGIVEGWPSEKVARRYLARACEANGLHSLLMKTDGTDGTQLTINNALAHVTEKIAITKLALEAEDA